MLEAIRWDHAPLPFYGKGRFTGKAAIGAYAIRTYAALSRKQRKRVLAMGLWVIAFSKRSRSTAGREFSGRRHCSSLGVQRSCGRAVSYEGVTYPSLRAAAAATGAHRNTITAHARPVNMRKRPACGGTLLASKRRRSTQSAGSDAKLAARRR